MAERARVFTCRRGLAALTLAAAIAAYGAPTSTGATRAAGTAPDSCSAAAVPTAATSPVLRARTTMIALSGAPFGVTTTPDGRRSFVAELGPSSAIAVFSDTGAAPRLIRTVPVPGLPFGLALVDRGRYLLAAGGTGATVVSVARAEAGAAHAVLGVVREPAAARSGGGGAIEVTASPDGRFAFVSLEGGAQIAVYNLAAELADQFRGAGYVGSVRVGLLPVGLAVSPDGRWLYVTSEIAGSALPSLRSGYRGTHGTLSVISLARAEHGPAHAVVATVDR